MTVTDKPFELRTVALAAFGPTLLFATGEGAILPMIPLIAADQGAGLGALGLIAAMIMVGELVGDLPSGALVQRLGERTAMIVASLVSIAGLLGCYFSTNPWVLGACVFVVGLSTAVFALARHAFITTSVPLRYRARALSVLGGLFRAGYFIGPFVSSVVLVLSPEKRSVFLVHVAFAAATLVLLLCTGDLSGADEAERRESRDGLLPTMTRHRGVLLRMGSCAALLGGLRASRNVVLPLVAVAAGLPPSTTALIIGIAGGIDFALSYTSGQIMDRWGRLWAAVPSMTGLALGHALLFVVTDVPTFAAVAILLGLANGTSSGILMTLGADLAPQSGPAPFLGAWRFTGDFGQAAGPLITSGLTALAGVGLAGAGMGVLGLLGAGLLLRYTPRYVPRRPAMG
ncbi:MFS transporter [Saccharopolyspora flava]|uniref:Predicted arabinose efflux permease, MFS family n=1 Tax=Saccharopolyspora flava TaxID=95161 RepID=A0A1I6SLX2_9PSEU|nr:MFS transporter [Saccharopolyspora flava]SFS77962.1 Predicted arabinose efflux permease, MFS family [Saccharopolyspora flava]